MFNFPLRMEFGLKFKNIGVLRINLTRKSIVFHEKQEKIQSVLLDEGQRSYFISPIE